MTQKKKPGGFRLPLLEDQPPHSLVYKLVDDPIARVDEGLLPTLASSSNATHTPLLRKGRDIPRRRASTA
jgi:hypothetical protein